MTRMHKKYAEEVPMAFELKYPDLDFTKLTAMEALLCGLKEGDYKDASVREAFEHHIKPKAGYVIQYYFDDKDLKGYIRVLDLSTVRGFKK